jgi:hypothetical protein
VAARLRSELGRLMEATGPSSATMPVDGGIKKTLPDASIR